MTSFFQSSPASLAGRRYFPVSLGFSRCSSSSSCDLLRSVWVTAALGLRVEQPENGSPHSVPRIHDQEDSDQLGIEVQARL